jgi:MATE family multidrug resistance protein
MLAGLFFPADAVQVVVAQALRARADVLAPTLTAIASYALVMLPLAAWLAIGLGLGLTGIVIAVAVASCVSAGLLVGRFWRLSRRAG